MLLFKRLVTTLVVFVILDFVASLGAIVAAGCITGMWLATQGPKASGGLNGERGIALRAEQFWPHFGPALLFASLGVAGVGALALSFSGALPWCRARPAPPPLPSPGT